MNVLKLSKGAIALFIVAGALVSCQKNTSQPTETKKDLTAQARLTNRPKLLGIRYKDAGTEIIGLPLFDTHVKNPDNSSSYTVVKVTAYCYLDKLANGKERIKKINVVTSNTGPLLGCAVAKSYRNHTGTYGNVGFGAVTSTHIPTTQYTCSDILFRYYPRNNSYGEPYFADGGNVTTIYPTTTKSYYDHVAFFLGSDGKIHYRWGL